ncbi:MAG: YbgF trimerization domain-containing protein [Burkholderiales bacterium]
MRGHRAAGALLGALLLAVCASAQAAFFDDEEARKQIAAERARINELQKQIDTRLGRLEETLKGQGLLDLNTQVQQARDEMAKLRGQLEVLNNNIENTTKRQRDMYIDLDTRLRRFESGGAVPAAGATPPPAAPPALRTASRVSARRLPGAALGWRPRRWRGSDQR